MSFTLFSSELLWHTFVRTHRHTHSISGASCSMWQVQRSDTIHGTICETRWERLCGLEGRLSLSPTASSEILETAGLSLRAQTRRGHYAPTSLWLLWAGIRWIYNISSTSSAPCSPALQGPWWVRGQCILTTRRQSTFTLMAPGQSAPWSCWDAGSHGNLWTRQQNRGEGRQHDLISHGFLVYLYIHIYVATNKYSFFMLPWFSARYFMNLSAKYMSLI